MSCYNIGSGYFPYLWTRAFYFSSGPWILDSFSLFERRADYCYMGNIKTCWCLVVETSLRVDHKKWIVILLSSKGECLWYLFDNGFCLNLLNQWVVITLSWGKSGSCGINFVIVIVKAYTSVKDQFSITNSFFFPSTRPRPYSHNLFLGVSRFLSWFCEILQKKLVLGLF